MKNRLNFLSVILVAVMMMSCASSKISPEQVKSKVYSNNFSFVAKEYENNTSYTTPEGTGRILSTNIPQVPDEEVGIQVSPEKLVINLPTDANQSNTNKYSLNKVSQDFTVAKKELKNGNILVNFFLKDHKDIDVVKMEIDKVGKIDCSVEGPKLKALYYVGYLKR